VTSFCDWVAVVAFGIALILAIVQPTAPASGRWSWPTFVALGLLAWVLPVALTASHIAHS
jgi:hypothetical protein